MCFLRLFHLKCWNKIFIDIKIQVKQRQHYNNLPHFIKKVFCDIFFQLIKFAEHIHGNQNCTTSNKKCTGYEIRPEVSAVPSRPVCSCKKPGSNCMDSKSHRNDSDAKDINGTVTYFELF